MKKIELIQELLKDKKVDSSETERLVDILLKTPLEKGKTKELFPEMNLVKFEKWKDQLLKAKVIMGVEDDKGYFIYISPFFKKELRALEAIRKKDKALEFLEDKVDRALTHLNKTAKSTALSLSEKLKKFAEGKEKKKE